MDCIRIKDILKELIPPFLYRIYNSIISGLNKGYIWEGIYKNFKEIPAIGDGYNDRKIISEVYSATYSLINESNNESYLQSNELENSILPIIVATLLEERRNNIKILDFGGGMGKEYIYVMNSILEKKKIDYYIIEKENVCKEGEKLYSSEDRVFFLHNLPDHIKEFDIVFICSSLQYVENYRDLLVQLMTYHPKYFLFTKLSAGDIPTYASCQINLGNNKIPYWFLNIEEIIGILEKGGYTLKYISRSPRKYNQKNFPKEFRLGKTMNLLFGINLK